MNVRKVVINAYAVRRYNSRDNNPYLSSYTEPVHLLARCHRTAIDAVKLRRWSRAVDVITPRSWCETPLYCTLDKVKIELDWPGLEAYKLL